MKKTTTKKASKKVLIAEDEKPMARALQAKLNHSGFDAETAFDGEEALSMIEKGKFDILLLDLMMPKVDGFGVLTELNKHKNKIPVIILTNLSQPEDEKRAKDLGAKDFFVKANTSLAEIVEHVERMMK